MKKQRKNLGIVLVSLLGLLSCKKENNPGNSQLAKLPAITQTGANTFGCLVNGNVLVSNKLYCTYVQTTQLPANNYFDFTLVATDSTSTGKQTISIYTPGILMLKDNTSLEIGAPANALDRWYADYNNDQVGVDYQTGPGSPDLISFTKVDTVNKILSGTFSFTALNSVNSNESTQVTEGRFDVHYTSN